MTVKKNKMDEATIAKLAGLLPCTSSFIVNFTPKIYDDVDDEYKPVFVLRPFTQAEVKRIGKFLEKSPNDEDYIITEVRKQLIDFSNLIDISTGNKLKFDHQENGGITKEQFEMLPAAVQGEIVTELLRISGMRV